MSALQLSDGRIAFFQKARDLTKQVELQCPFADSFSIMGLGKGIVWTVAAGRRSSIINSNNQSLWLRTKSEQLPVSVAGARNRANQVEIYEVRWEAHVSAKGRQIIDAGVDLFQMEAYIHNLRIESTQNAVDAIQNRSCHTDPCKRRAEANLLHSCILKFF